MIHPRMATMLSVVLTDAAVAPEVLWGLLRPAAARTWDQLSVDGDTSTNDTVFVLASGASAAAPVAAGIDGRRRPRRRDRGGRARPRPPAGGRRRGRQHAHHGRGDRARADDAEARAVARAVVSSSLVKAAAHGRDPNWGRIAGAAGNARLADAAVLEAGGLSAGRGDGPCRHPGRARPGPAPDLDRRPPRVRRRRRRAGRLRSCRGAGRDGGARGRPRPRPRSRRRPGRGVRLRPDRGSTCIENSEYTT